MSRGRGASDAQNGARVFIAQGRYTDAERAASSAVRTLGQGDRQSLLADALTTHGTALARLGFYDKARATLYRAIEAAQQSGALNSAGLAALVLIEELSGHLAADELQTVYQRAYQWLSGSQHSETRHRLLEAAGVVIGAGGGAQGEGEPPEATGRGTLRDMVRGYEREIIRQALRKAEGSVTQAARLLGVSYQSLAHTIKRRHADLLLERTPAKKRRRSIIKKK